MKPTILVPFVAAWFFLLQGCSGKLQRAKVDTITLNVTTAAEISNMFGLPYGTDHYTDSSGAASTTYLYQEDWTNYLGEKPYANMGPEFQTTYRWLTVETRNGVVRGYVFACNDNSRDRTDF